VLHVQNLSFDVTWKEVEELFKQHARIGKVLLRKKEGKFIGVASVYCASVKDARKAVNALNGTMFKSRPLLIRQDKFVGMNKSEGANKSVDVKSVDVKSVDDEAG
jgi:RNA recognition motif-containing protein